MGSDTN